MSISINSRAFLVVVLFSFVWVALFRYRSMRALAFPPFCATSASASPRGRRERTVVRPLALGLASLNSHQTDENASLEGALSAKPIRAFIALFRLRSIRALATPISLRSIRLRSCAISPVGLNTRTLDLTAGLSGVRSEGSSFFFYFRKKNVDTHTNYTYKPPSPTG